MARERVTCPCTRGQAPNLQWTPCSPCNIDGCNHKTNKGYNMGRHRRTVHGCLLHPPPGKAAKGPKVCCDEVFVTLYEYARHRQRNHGDGHLCLACARIFSRRSHLARHSFVHSGVKPYGCGLCGYASAVFSNLERHVGTAKCRRNAERIAAGLTERPKPKGVRVLIPDVATMIAAQALLELGRQARVFKPDRP